jgi:hypothetical protein
MPSNFPPQYFKGAAEAARTERKTGIWPFQSLKGKFHEELARGVLLLQPQVQFRGADFWQDGNAVVLQLVGEVAEEAGA